MHIESEFPLPELAPWDHPGDEADVRIRLGEVPPFAGMENEMCPLTVLDPCHARICIPGVAPSLCERAVSFSSIPSSQ